MNHPMATAQIQNQRTAAYQLAEAAANARTLAEKLIEFAQQAGALQARLLVASKAKEVDTEAVSRGWRLAESTHFTSVLLNRGNDVQVARSRAMSALELVAQLTELAAEIPAD